MSDIRPGDRVRVDPSVADEFIQPYRGWIENGRIATVVGDGIAPSYVELQFDCGRKPKRLSDYRLRRISPRYLVLLARP